MNHTDIQSESGTVGPRQPADASYRRAGMLGGAIGLLAGLYHTATMIALLGSDSLVVAWSAPSLREVSVGATS
jgi:hypothetical protein